MQEFDNNYEVNAKTLDSKVIFGKLMVDMRVSNQVVLTSILGNIVKTSCDNQYLYIYTKDDVLYNQLSKKSNIDILNNSLKKFTFVLAKPVLESNEDKIDLEKIISEKFKDYYVK